MTAWLSTGLIFTFVAIALFVACFGYILVKKFKVVKETDCSPTANKIDLVY